MKKVLLILVASLAFIGSYAQCNLAVVNKTSHVLDFHAVESTGYYCGGGGSIASSMNGNTTINISHFDPLANYWVGIHISNIDNNSVNFGYPNYLASGCPQNIVGLTVTWVNACRVEIDY